MSAVTMEQVEHEPPAQSSKDHARWLVRAGVSVVLGAFLPIGAWITIAPLSLAVVGSAVVKVDLNRRPVQHLEGGIVREVLVRDGQRVQAGDPVLVLGDVGVDADRNRLTYRIQVERAALARFEAEQVRAATLVFPAELREIAKQDERIKDALVKETALFQARRDSLVSEIALMNLQRERVDSELEAVRAQIALSEESHALQKQDLDVNNGLVQAGFLSQNKVRQLEANVIDYSAKLQERRSELARASQRRGDIDLRIRTAQNEYVRSASDQLKVTVGRLAEIEQELRKSTDASTRQVVTAPASGDVIDLKFTSPGAVVRPGETIAEVVPSDTKLTIEAQIRPEDVNNVQIDQAARIKFTALKLRNADMVRGKVSYVSADRLVDKTTNMPYYSVTIIADHDSLASVGDLKLQAGMPAEVYIEGVTQTPLQYLIDPITSVVRKAGRQM
jgi:membrane fusion protein, epimerase transport system